MNSLALSLAIVATFWGSKPMMEHWYLGGMCFRGIFDLWCEQKGLACVALGICSACKPLVLQSLYDRAAEYTRSYYRLNSGYKVFEREIVDI